MRKTALSALVLAGSLTLAGASFAQEPAAGGATAKANAPIKAPHTLNDGAAKPGANSFTEGEARQHILHAGYKSVSNLTKDKNGLWQGVADRGSGYVNVALDYKGTVSEGGPRPPGAEGLPKASSMMAKKSGAAN